MKLNFKGNAKKGNQADVNWDLALDIPAEDLVALYNSDGEYPGLLRELISIVKDEQSFSHDWKKSQDQEKREEAKKNDEEWKGIHETLKKNYKKLACDYGHVVAALKGFGVNPESENLVDDLKEVIQSGKTDWRYPED